MVIYSWGFLFGTPPPNKKRAGNIVIFFRFFLLFNNLRLVSMEKGDYRAIHRNSSISHKALHVWLLSCIITPSKEGTNNGSYREFG